jgi:hypothetical protein
VGINNRRPGSERVNWRQKDARIMKRKEMGETERSAPSND